MGTVKHYENGSLSQLINLTEKWAFHSNASKLFSFNVVSLNKNFFFTKEKKLKIETFHFVSMLASNNGENLFSLKKLNILEDSQQTFFFAPFSTISHSGKCYKT